MDTPVRVNRTKIPAAAIAAEMQFHQAATPEEAWTRAATALAIRALLMQEAERLNIAADPEAEENMEEALIRALLAQEMTLPETDEESCRRYFEANRRRFRGKDVYEAAHILFPAAPDDTAARTKARQAAEEILKILAADPSAFAALARARSACPSGANGGKLGQQSRGDLVPEIETFLVALEPGSICPVPVVSRYGVHVLRLDRMERAADMEFETARPWVERELATKSWQRAVSQYLRILAGRARIEGVALHGAATQLVQ